MRAIGCGHYSPKEARRGPDDRGRMVGNPYLTALRQSCPSLGSNALIPRRCRGASSFRARQSCHTSMHEQFARLCLSCRTEWKDSCRWSVSSHSSNRLLRSFQSSTRCWQLCTPRKPDGGRLEREWHTYRSRRRSDAAGMRVLVDQQREECSLRLIG